MIRIDLNKSLRKLQDAEPLTLEQRAESMGESPEYARNVQKLIDEGATIQELAKYRVGTVSGLSQLFPDAEVGTAPQRSSSSSPSSSSSSSSSSSGGGATSEIEAKASEFGMTPEKYTRYYNRGARMINEGKSIDDLVNMSYGTRGSLTRMFPTAPTETVKVEETPEESSNLDNLSQDEINALWVQMGNDIKDAPKAKNPEGNRIMKDFQPLGYLPDLEDEDESLKNLNEDLDYFKTEEYLEFAEDIYDSEEEAAKATEEITNRLIGRHGHLILRNKEKEKEYRERTPTFTGERPQYNVNIQPEQTQSSTFTSSYTPDLLQFDQGLTMQSDNTTVANNFNFPLETNYSRPGEDFVTTNSLADRDFSVFGLDYTPLKLDINLTDIEESGVTSNLFGTASAPQRAHDELENIVKPFAESLTNNKEKIMGALSDRGTPIASYEYDAIAPLVFGVFGAESGLGDTKTDLENIFYTGAKATVGGRSADPEAELELYEMIDKTADPFFSMDPADYSVGWTQLNWNANLTDKEEELLAELGITSPRDLIDPELSALATMALFASRKSGRAEMSDAELLDTWNKSPSYDAKVNKFASFITPYSQLPDAKDKGAIPSVTTTGSYSDSHATGLKNTFVDFLESLVYKEGGEVPEDEEQVTVLSSASPPKQSYEEAADTYTPENYRYSPYRASSFEAIQYYAPEFDLDVDFIDASNERFPAAKDAFYDSEVFMQEWMNSPQYEKLLLESTAGKPGVMKYGREDNLASAKGNQFITGDIGEFSAGTIGAMSFNRSPATIYNYHSFDSTPWLKSTAVHELSHSTDRPYADRYERLIPESDIEFATNLLLSRDEVSDNFEEYGLYTGSESGLSEEAYQYYADPTELRARGNQARAVLVDDGVDIFTQDVTIDDIDDAIDAFESGKWGGDKSKYRALMQLVSLYGKEGTVSFLNTVSQAEPQEGQEEMFYGKQGGKIQLDLEKKLGVDINKLDPLPIGTSYKSRKFFQKNPLAAVAYGKNPFRKAGSPPRDLLA